MIVGLFVGHVICLGLIEASLGDGSLLQFWLLNSLVYFELLFKLVLVDLPFVLYYWLEAGRKCHNTIVQLLPLLERLENFMVLSGPSAVGLLKLFALKINAGEVADPD